MNRLASEPSRYLRQHAHQPVDWWPWGPEALAEAARRDVPLFVSIGYSSCHWCHVMAHESFDDPAVAALVNAAFVPIKVDREERPDVDAVYMDAVVATTGSGGWPMSVFATPDGRPFLCGTYFPPEDRHGLPSFTRVVSAVIDAWRERRPEVDAQATALADAVARRLRAPLGVALARDDADRSQGAPTSSPITLEPEPDAQEATSGPTTPRAKDPTGQAPILLDRVANTLVSRLDEPYGGFGPAPKFPQPTLLELLLCHHRLSGDDRSLHAAITTLAGMAAGGIFDHLAGGFARYSTDATWTVPHFEKMLYDQAGLLRVYVHAWQVTGDARWRQVAEEVATFVLEAMALPDGGLASALDADSEGEEGRFYVWSDDELRQVLGADLPVVAEWYQVDGAPVFDGRHVLRRPVGAPLARPPLIDQARRRLLAARNHRPPPGRDDKVITEWNAMMASSLAEAAAAMGIGAWASAAVAVVEHLVAKVRLAGTDRLARTWQDGTARHLATAADHAWLIDATTRVAELTADRRWVDVALATTDHLLRHFDAGDVLAMTADDAEHLMARPVEVADGATPSATATAAVALLRLGALTGRRAITAAGERLAFGALAAATEAPIGAASTLVAATLGELGITEISVSGSALDLLAPVRQQYLPAGMTLPGGPLEPTAHAQQPVPAPAPAQAPTQVPAPALAHAPAPAAGGAGLVHAPAEPIDVSGGGTRPPIDTEPPTKRLATVCRRSTCSAPVDDESALLALVTQALAEDRRWFTARVADQPMAR